MFNSHPKTGPVIVIILVLMTAYYVIVFSEARTRHVAVPSDGMGSKMVVK